MQELIQCLASAGTHCAFDGSLAGQQPAMVLTWTWLSSAELPLSRARARRAAFAAARAAAACLQRTTVTNCAAGHEGGQAV